MPIVVSPSISFNDDKFEITGVHIPHLQLHCICSRDQSRTNPTWTYDQFLLSHCPDFWLFSLMCLVGREVAHSCTMFMQLCGSAAHSKFDGGQTNYIDLYSWKTMKDLVWMQILVLRSAPMRQDYGYSGVAKPPNSNANIAMYAVGGAAVGAVAGAGAMYAYNNMILGSKWRMFCHCLTWGDPLQWNLRCRTAVSNFKQSSRPPRHENSWDADVCVPDHHPQLVLCCFEPQCELRSDSMWSLYRL